MCLIGIGSGGCAIAREIARSHGPGLAYVLADTDAATGTENEPFILIGGARLAGHGAGGNYVNARMAAEDSLPLIDEAIGPVRLAVIVTTLGGGTGSGATIVITQHLRERGIPTLVFATRPFAFEGERCARVATDVTGLIEESAGAAFVIPFDRLVGEEDNMQAALRRGVETLGAAITLFWRLVSKPGYIRLDTERIRHLVSNAGRGRFAVVTAEGENRVERALDSLARSPLLIGGKVGQILCGVLAGDDLRLSEIGRIAEGIRSSFGDKAAFELATVNDESGFGGRLSVVVLLFEAGGAPAPLLPAVRKETAPAPAPARPRRGGRARQPPGVQPQGRFNNVEQTYWHQENLDIPTFIRRNIELEP